MTWLAFDLDGTIYDCKNIIVEAFQEGIISFIKYYHIDVKVPDKDKIISVLGTPHDLIFKNLFPELKDEEQQIVNNYCTRSLVEMVKNKGGEIFSGVNTTLERLYSENYRIIAASNGNIDYIEAILKSNELDKYFTKPIIYLSDEISDKSEIIKYYKDNICNNELLIMIGDRYSDRKAALDNNIPFIGCSFGHADDEELQGSRWMTREFTEIYYFIREIETEK